MKTIVVYSSQTGFTEKYAKWIAEALNCEAIPVKQAKKLDISQFHTVIYGGWCMAGSVNGLKWILNKVPNLVADNKKFVVYAVGGSPMENPELEQGMKNISNKIEALIPENLDKEKIYKLVYCPGGFNYDKMNKGSKIMMKMFLSMLKSNKNKTPADEEMIKMISSNYDITDKKYIQPILDFVK